ncbi:flagellar biosynthesis protein FlhB [Turicibacter sanguinis]|uniref:flagellar biosynthesis protein FlhB n=1 Tax=Turicibacter sanguinis TaxID=154288 RepID=UPI0018A8F7AA|nr:flagellar biosynthesis protein FlhB [Turicibacter sanguinis]MDB8551131.1 flagellar biosynthesis protein FlhB [Turicibacter sanguinis]
MLIVFSVINCLIFCAALIIIFQPKLLMEDVLESGLMLFASGREEKTEKASPKKLKDARKKGQVVKSTDVNNLMMMLTSFLVISVFGTYLVDDVEKIMKYFLLNSYDASLINSTSNSLYVLILSLCLKLAIFIFVPLVLMGIVANIMQTGFLFTQETLKFQFNKLNPITGFKNMFSRQKLLSSLKNIILLIVLSVVSYSFIFDHQSDLMKLPYMAYTDILSTVGSMISQLVIKILMIVAFIAAMDYGIQYVEFMRNLKMTKQEVKEEYKQMEGDPFVKGKRRQKQREMAMSRMAIAVAESTVVVTNPTHFAVALKYIHDSDSIPKVMAKGVDFKAQKIKELAKENNVPIIENKPLARALYRDVEVDQEIPFELYKAVAEVLAIVYNLEKKRNYY